MSAAAGPITVGVDDVDAAAGALVRDHAMRSTGPSTTTPGEPGRRTTFQHPVTPWGSAVDLVGRQG